MPTLNATQRGLLRASLTRPAHGRPPFFSCSCHLRDWVNADNTQRAIGDTPANGGVELTGKIHAKLKLPVGIWRPGTTPAKLEWNYYVKVSENGTVKAEIWYDVRIVIPQAKQFSAKEIEDKKDSRGREVVIEAYETANKIY